MSRGNNVYVRIHDTAWCGEFLSFSGRKDICYDIENIPDFAKTSDCIFKTAHDSLTNTLLSLYLCPALHVKTSVSRENYSLALYEASRLVALLVT